MESDMDHIAPLIQTLLWVALVGGITWRFQKPIHALLEALAERVKSGSDVKAGPFSISGMQPLAPPEQAARANAEIEEAYKAIDSGWSAAPAYSASPIAVGADPVQPNSDAVEARTSAPPPQFRAQYFQAEDLALRAIQAEFGQPIDRQVTGGYDRGFDGAFVLNNRLNIVEVKYVAKRPPASLMRATIDQIQSVVNRYRWRSVNIIFAAVVDRTSDVEDVRVQLTEIADETAIPTVVRVYALSELQAQFGVLDKA
jgi:hypothetical protein